MIGDDAEQPRRAFRQHHLLAQQPDEIAIGLHQRRSAPAQQPRLHLAHEAGEQRRQQQHQQHLRALEGEFADHGHIASTSSSRHQRRKHQREIAADGEELQDVEPVGGIADRARDRRIERSPRSGRAFRPSAAPARSSPAAACRRSRARGTPACRRRAGSAARSSTRCIASPGSDRDSRNPRPARAAAGRRPADGWRRRQARPRRP